MRNERPAQWGDGGPWHYVSLNDKGGYPIGYCTHDCDHATREEAHEHYRQWVLDGLREVTGDPSTLRLCQVEGCPAYTDKALGEPDGWRLAHLCDEHRNRGEYERSFYPPGSAVRESWVS